MQKICRRVRCYERRLGLCVFFTFHTSYALNFDQRIYTSRFMAVSNGAATKTDDSEIDFSFKQMLEVVLNLFFGTVSAQYRAAHPDLWASG